MPKIRDFNRVTALYERLSKDDEQQGESNSILNQKRFLEDFARKSGMTNIKHFTDDGYTGRNFNRPGFQAILFEVADKGVNFLDEMELSAEDAFSASAPRMGRPNAREEAATDFIRSLLAGGRRLASDCEAKLEAAGFKKSTYKKSKKKAGVRSVKDGFLWYWTLPEVEKPIENGQEVTDEDDLPI